MSSAFLPIPNEADDSAANTLDGGYNNGPAPFMESWESTRIGQVQLDFDPNGNPVGHSEPQGTAYFNNGSGVSGVWVTERDGPAGGDDLAFLDLTASSKSSGTALDQGTAVYRKIQTPLGGIFDSTVIFNDPNDYTADPNTTTPDGKIEQVFVDSNGDLIVVESGFLDSDPNGIGLAMDHQPAVYRIPVTSYGNSGDPNSPIVLGTPGPKFFLDSDPADPNNFQQTPGEDPNFLERGHWSAFDEVTNTVFFAVAGGPGDPEDPNAGTQPGNESPAFGLDIWTINVDTGAVTSHLDLDDSISLFLSSGFDDVVEFFSISDGIPGDFNSDGVVDGFDFLEWQINPSIGLLSDWEANYGMSSNAGVVPEPSSVALLLMALAPMGLRRNRQS